MAACKCKLCKKLLSTNDAYCVITYDKNGKAKKSFYCSEEEFNAEEARKRKAAADKNRAYRLVCEIIGCKEIINTILYKEWAVWNKVADNEKIWRYLEENKDYLCDVISRLEDVEFNRIRYLSAILKNKLGDYKPKVEEKPRPKMTMTFYEPVQTHNNRRRSLSDLEDEL